MCLFNIAGKGQGFAALNLIILVRAFFFSKPTLKITVFLCPGA